MGSKERSLIAVEHIRKYLTLSRVFGEFGVHSNESERGDEYTVSCPFHDDKRPSLGINDQRGVWHCFSCGRGGDAVSAYRSLMYARKGISVAYDDAIDQLLARCPNLEILPFTTVHEAESRIVAEDFTVNRYRPGVVVPRTMSDVYRYMRKAGLVSFEDVAIAVDQMLARLGPDTIIAGFDRRRDSQGLAEQQGPSVSVEELMSSLDWGE
jgi:hypothetical protein